MARSSFCLTSFSSFPVAARSAGRHFAETRAHLVQRAFASQRFDAYGFEFFDGGSGGNAS